MKTTQKIIVLLLVLAIVFSVFSIVVSLNASKIDVSQVRPTVVNVIRDTEDTQSGGVAFIVERSSG